MRIYSNPIEAARETERELWEMGIDVHPQTMQDKVVKDDPDYLTKEIRGYVFKIAGWKWDFAQIRKILQYFFGEEEAERVLQYILTEFKERISGTSYNPGAAYEYRRDVWQEFLHEGHFAYTYSERIAPQLMRILSELQKNPETRQGILTIHSNISPLLYGRIENTGQRTNYIETSADLYNIGGGGRVPCSMYYQILIRRGRVDLIYTMRSCDFLTHFPVDISLALFLQNWIRGRLKLDIGEFTWFCGSLHAYAKDMKKRGIF